MRMLRRRLLVSLALVAPALAVLRRAAASSAAAPAPYVPAAQFVQAIYFQHALPRAEQFHATVATLRDALAVQPLQRDEAQRAWVRALQAWSELNAVPVGPQLNRRSARRIDFQPTRPEQVRRSIERRKRHLKALLPAVAALTTISLRVHAGDGAMVCTKSDGANHVRASHTSQSTAPRTQRRLQA